MSKSYKSCWRSDDIEGEVFPSSCRGDRVSADVIMYGARASYVYGLGVNGSFSLIEEDRNPYRARCVFVVPMLLFSCYFFAFCVYVGGIDATLFLSGGYSEL